MNNFDAPFASPLVHYTGMATFLLGALSLTVPSGYSIGAALLLLGSIMLVRKHPFIKLESKDIWLIVVMAIFSFVGMGDAWWGGGTIREIDKPSRFLLAIPAMLLVLVYPPRPAWLWAGLALGAFGAGVLAGWQFFIEGMQRTGGMTQTIQFGNIALLLGMLCLAGIRWAWSQSCRACWLMLLTMGTLGGLSASLLSGSRGGWIALPPILFTLYIAYSQVLKLRWKVSFTLLFFLIGTLIYATPFLGVQSRVDTAVIQVVGYLAGDKSANSISLRFEMWKGAAYIGWEHPWIGVGVAHYEDALRELADKGLIIEKASYFGHAHNELLDAWAKRGLLGLTALVLVYILPTTLFSKGLRSRNISQQSIAVAGTILPVAFLSFSLTQGFFSHNSGVMVYAFWLSVLWGLYRSQEYHYPCGSKLPGSVSG